MLPLRPPDRVVLLVEDVQAMPATVVATGSAEVTLVLDAGAALPARMLHRRRAVLERHHDGTRFRGQGDLAMVEGATGAVRDDAVVFHFRARDQRRAFVRVPAVLPATVVPLDAPVPPARGLTIDLSAAGVLVRSGAKVEPGNEVHVHLQLPDEELPIPAAGAVVRRTETGLLGVRLDRMRPHDRALVERWLRRQR